MACSCQKREKFEVVTNGGNGRVVHIASEKAAAISMSARHPGSVVRSTKTKQIVHRAATSTPTTT